MKQLNLKLLLLILVTIASLPSSAQIKLMPDYLAIGKVTQPRSAFINIQGINSLTWVYNDHFLKIDMAGAIPALSGTNRRIDIADTSHGGVMYLSFTCASVYSVAHNSFLTPDTTSPLQTLRSLIPYQATTVESGVTKTVYGLTKAKGASKLSENSQSQKLIVTDTDGSEILDNSELIQLLLQAIIELNEVTKFQEIEIKQLENQFSININP